MFVFVNFAEDMTEAVCWERIHYGLMLTDRQRCVAGGVC